MKTTVKLRLDADRQKVVEEQMERAAKVAGAFCRTRPERLEDYRSEAWAAVSRAIARPEMDLQRSDLPQFVATVAHNACVSYYRDYHRLRGYRRNRDESLRGQGPRVVPLSRMKVGPDGDTQWEPADRRAAERASLEDRDLVEALMRRLTPKQREAVEAVYLNGMTQKEFAEATGRRKGGIWLLLQKALETMKGEARRQGVLPVNRE